jgi:2-polyprenyl-3-methyl-5-hydroxy-6-metoxy-1,4-benzoquinol methylase
MTKSSSSLLLCLALMLATVSPIPAVAQGTVQQKSSDPGVHPISGRRYAMVMGYAGADWLERPERIFEENPDLAVDLLDLKPGMAVADVGAGTGYFSVRMARKVGPTGRVYASDLQEPMLKRLARNVAREKINNIETVLATESDPNLPLGMIDLILMVDVYHEFSQPQEMLRKLRAALKPGGRMVLLEYRKEDPTVPIRPEHKMSVAEAKLEVEAEGFKLTQKIDKLPRQHVLVFTKMAPAAAQ